MFLLCASCSFIFGLFLFPLEPFPPLFYFRFCLWWGGIRLSLLSPHTHTPPPHRCKDRDRTVRIFLCLEQRYFRCAPNHFIPTCSTQRFGPLRSGYIILLGSFGRTNPSRVIGNICSLLSSSCFLAHANVAHHGHEIGRLALCFVLVLFRSFYLLFIGRCCFSGPGDWPLALDFVLVLCLAFRHPRQSDVVGLGLMITHCCSVNNDSGFVL